MKDWLKNVCAAIEARDFVKKRSARENRNAINRNAIYSRTNREVLPLRGCRLSGSFPQRFIHASHPVPQQVERDIRKS